MRSESASGCQKMGRRSACCSVQKEAIFFASLPKKQKENGERKREGRKGASLLEARAGGLEARAGSARAARARSVGRGGRHASRSTPKRAHTARQRRRVVRVLIGRFEYGCFREHAEL